LLEVRPWPLERRRRLLLEDGLRLGLRPDALLSQPRLRGAHIARRRLFGVWDVPSMVQVKLRMLRVCMDKGGGIVGEKAWTGKQKAWVLAIRGVKSQRYLVFSYLSPPAVLFFCLTSQTRHGLYRRIRQRHEATLVLVN
jgi:hypothetical protein